MLGELWVSQLVVLRSCSLARHLRLVILARHLRLVILARHPSQTSCGIKELFALFQACHPSQTPYLDILARHPSQTSCGIWVVL